MDDRVSMMRLIDGTVNNFVGFFEEAISEIKLLRQQIGEQIWTNQELKLAVKEKPT